MRKGEGSDRMSEEESAQERQEPSTGIEETSSKESRFEGRKASRGTTVQREDSTVFSERSESAPPGNTGLGQGVGLGRSWNMRIWRYPEMGPIDC